MEDEKLIKDMKPGERGYAVPWAVDFETMTLNTRFSVSERSGGTCCMEVICCAPGMFEFSEWDVRRFIEDKERTSKEPQKLERQEMDGFAAFFFYMVGGVGGMFATAFGGITFFYGLMTLNPVAFLVGLILGVFGLFAMYQAVELT